MKKNPPLEVVVFLTGAVVMVLELVGSRVLAPYLGTSLVVWTSLIGVILGCLSLGYWLGGLLADKKKNPKMLADIVMISALSVELTAFFKETVMVVIGSAGMNMYFKSLFSTLFLFGVPSVLLGMVSPYAVTLALSKISKSGSTSGKLYAFSTLGSIAGTFLAGFWLIPTLGNGKIILLLAVVLAVVSLMIDWKNRLIIRVCILILFAYLSFFAPPPKAFMSNYVDIDTKYARVVIGDVPNFDGQPARVMWIDGEMNSAVYSDKEGTPFRYFRYFDLAKQFLPEARKVMLIGGAGYAYPTFYINKNPGSTMDVVELNDGLLPLAKKYFGYTDNERIRIFHEDGRTYLNNNTKKYDAVFVDAFKGFTVPYQLTTIEAAKLINKALADKGVVVMNIVGSIEGETGEFVRAEYETYKQVFDQVYLFLVNSSNEPSRMQNVSLVALKGKITLNLESDDPETIGRLKTLYDKEVSKGLVLTDEYAPVDFMVIKTFRLL